MDTAATGRPGDSVGNPESFYWLGRGFESVVQSHDLGFLLTPSPTVETNYVVGTQKTTLPLTRESHQLTTFFAMEKKRVLQKEDRALEL